MTGAEDDRGAGGPAADPGANPPPFPDALLAEGARTPGGWVYAIDPAYDPAGDVPPEAIAGAWHIGDDGRPTGEYRANPGYGRAAAGEAADAAPGAAAPVPPAPLLATLLGLDLGTATPADVHARLLAGTVLVALDDPPPGARAQFVAAPDADGHWALLAFSDPRTLAAWGEPPAAASFAGRELLALAAAKGIDRVVVDPAGPVRVTLSAGEVAALGAGRLPGPADAAATPAPVEGPLTLRPPEPAVEEHVLAALRAALEDLRGLSRAYVAEGPRSGLRRTLVVVLEPAAPEDAGALAAAVPALAARLEPLVAAEGDLRFTVAERDERLAEIAAVVAPAYER